MVDKIAIMNRARLEKRRARDVEIVKKAKQFFEKNKNDVLFMSGIALYWAEGTRMISNKCRKYQLAMTNSDSGLAAFYCRFLKKYFADISIDDWRAGLFLYPDIKKETAVSYWSQIIGIPKGQFIKPQILKSNYNGKRLKFGTCCLYVNSKDACLAMRQ